MKDINLTLLKPFFSNEPHSSFASFLEFLRIERFVLFKNRHIDYKIYTEEICNILKENHKYEWVDYFNKRKINIAVYPGSFNPMHKGHLSILEKAEKIFDKVIIARGKSPDKEGHSFELPNTVQNRQIETYDGLLTDFLDSLGYEVTVIRGLRNATDLQYETVQLRFMQDLKPNIKMVSIFCDQELEHISSSAIRMLAKYGKAEKYEI